MNTMNVQKKINSGSGSSVATSSNSTTTETGSNSKIFMIIGFIIGVILLVIAIIFIAKKYKETKPNDPVKQTEAADALLKAKGGGNQGFQNQLISNSNSNNNQEDTSDDQPLINYNVLGCRLAGYLGPGTLQDRDNFGTFDEKTAIDKALLLGARVFIFDIDYLEDKPGDPVLVSRDRKGNLMSVSNSNKDNGPFKNVGSISKCTNAIANGIKAGKNNNEPIICVLSFLRLPNGNPRGADGLRFMQKVYTQFKPLIPYILSSNINGTYVHRRKETELFLSPKSNYRNSVIMLTNIDTTGFTLEKLPDGIELENGDLDKIIHARIYSSLEKSPLRLYEIAKNGQVGASYANTIEYYTTIPQDKIGYESDITRKNWSFAITPEFEDSTPDLATLATLHDKIGVQCIPINMFYVPDNAKENNGDIDITKIPIYSAKWFKSRSFRLKPVALRYELPSRKVIDKPNPQMDTRGGFVQTTSARNK